MDTAIKRDVDVRGLVWNCIRIFRDDLGFRIEQRPRILGYTGKDVPEEDKLIRELSKNEDGVTKRGRLIIDINVELTKRFGAGMDHRKREWLERGRPEFKSTAKSMIGSGDISLLKQVLLLTQNLDS